jgi:hypothetical protein
VFLLSHGGRAMEGGGASSGGGGCSSKLGLIRGTTLCPIDVHVLPLRLGRNFCHASTSPSMVPCTGERMGAGSSKETAAGRNRTVRDNYGRELRRWFDGMQG